MQGSEAVLEPGPDLSDGSTLFFSLCGGNLAKDQSSYPTLKVKDNGTPSPPRNEAAVFSALLPRER